MVLMNFSGKVLCIFSLFLVQEKQQFFHQEQTTVLMTHGCAQSETDVSGGQSERTEEHQYVKKSLPSRKGQC